MAEKITVHDKDVVVIFKDHEYSALLAFLYGLQDIEKLREASKKFEIELSGPQLQRISEMWSKLAQNKER